MSKDITPPQKLSQYLDEIYETNKFGKKFIRYDKKPNKELIDYYANKYGINKNCHNTCHVCQITHIEKYKPLLEFDDAKLKSEGKPGLDKWFKPQCSFIEPGLDASFIKPKLEELVKAGIPERRAKRMIMQAIDPVNWLELLMGFDDETQKLEIEKHWYLRWYQKAPVRCTSNRLVLRAGRRTGKSTTAALKIISWVFNHKVFGHRNAEGEEVWKGPKIAIITPFQSQVTAIFSEIERLILINSALASEVIQTGSKLFKQTPPLSMTFKNGAVIEGYVTGANDKEDGSGGGSIRGAYADILYIDEMDMVPEYILTSVIAPLLRSRPATKMLASSTPIGKKGSFYKYCLEDPQWTEFYFPGTVLPFWHLQEEEILREGTQDSFNSEYMAVFNVDSFGAFKSKDIHAARSNYNYEQTEDPKWWSTGPFKTNYHAFSRCMGIDWNQNVGTEMSITGFDPKHGDFKVLENYLIEPSEYSGQTYTDAVKRLNYKWDPKYIYCDHGWGHTLIENLQLESAAYMARYDSLKSDYERSIAKLGDKIRVINFSSNLEIFNPAKNTFDTKYAKSFLVENAISIFERHKILFSEEDKTLIKQLQNYYIVEKKENGRVVYGMVNEKIGDHRLDALMLSLGGIVIEEGVFSYNSYAGDVNSQYLPPAKDVEEADPTDNYVFDGKGQLVGFKTKSGSGSNNLIGTDNPNDPKAITVNSLIFKKSYNHDNPNQPSNTLFKHSSRGNLGGQKEITSNLFSQYGVTPVTNHSSSDDVGEDPLPMFRKQTTSVDGPYKINPNRKAFGKKIRTNL